MEIWKIYNRTFAAFFSRSFINQTCEREKKERFTTYPSYPELLNAFSFRPAIKYKKQIQLPTPKQIRVERSRRICLEKFGTTLIYRFG